MDEDQIREAARKRVDANLQFQTHFRTYLLVIAFLAIINITTSPHYLWFLWAAGGWGIGISLQAQRVYGHGQDPGKREAMIEDEIRELSSTGRSRDQ
ncbi:MAG: 2TM domain-containing protein [Myxococcota bacterium]|nr:2TM domain-containing protein [Myxococcota bacterium]